MRVGSLVRYVRGGHDPEVVMLGVVMGPGILMTNGVQKAKVFWSVTGKLRDEYEDWLEVVS